MDNRMAALRKQAGLTQQQVADKLGVSKATVAQYESGKIKTVKPEHLEILSGLYNAMPGYILGLSNMRQELNDREEKLIDGYRRLNDIGKYEMQHRLWELSQIKDYKDAIINTEDNNEDYLAPVAAHADDAPKEILLAEIKRIKKLVEG